MFNIDKKLTLKAVEESLGSMPFDEAIKKLLELKCEHGSKFDRLITKYTKKRECYEKELVRFENMTVFEKEGYKSNIKYIAGIDEAGRGPLAGPVVAAAVVLPQDVFINGLDDSKKLSQSKREELFEIIKEKALAYGVGIVEKDVIDDINILNATRMAMKIAVDNLKVIPQLLLIDAEKLEEVSIPQKSIIKGDTLSISIAAASIIAKVTRDNILHSMDSKYPQYGFKKHKGYGTKEHIEAIKKYGICPIHRISYTKNFMDI